jgi:hypothetical protein
VARRGTFSKTISDTGSSFHASHISQMHRNVNSFRAWYFGVKLMVSDSSPDPPNPVPAATQTKLLNEWRRKPLNQLRVDPVNPAVIIAEQIIPADEGGKWIREIGLYDADGDLVAVANCAPSFKPLLSQGSRRSVRRRSLPSSRGPRPSVPPPPVPVSRPDGQR